MDEFERCILVKQEVFVYKIPPRQSAKGFRAADWNLSVPDWTGRLRVMEKAHKVKLKLEDRGSNELFAACPVDQYPGPAIEAVTDSSRYFVIKIVGDDARSAFIGIGFSDRSDSFDLNVALQDYFKGVTRDAQISKEEVAPSKPSLDLAFKAGQTIKVNINIPKSEKAKARPKTGGGPLPPPPGGGSARPPQNNNDYKASGGEGAPQAPGPAALTPLSPAPATVDLLGGLDLTTLTLANTNPPSTVKPEDPWGAFESASTADGQSSKEWVGF